MQIAFSESCPIKSSTGWEDDCGAEACGWEGIMVDSQRSDVHDDRRTARRVSSRSEQRSPFRAGRVGGGFNIAPPLVEPDVRISRIRLS